ncbi:hypothetical protein LOK49_LG04G00821 [Camellia lanceoleosa]|uniref:Uncharacterized protein n=1 Tax=Camellia lanceoleosa TaxID=1840588 RepID=A0ACC0I4W6_9ERIC|nr:hypothetical protein LOK49_LG04G00821 [Camellia lanceoleosa]
MNEAPSREIGKFLRVVAPLCNKKDDLFLSVSLTDQRSSEPMISPPKSTALLLSHTLSPQCVCVCVCELKVGFISTFFITKSKNKTN